jgi:hypothetical protein
MSFLVLREGMKGITSSSYFIQLFYFEYFNVEKLTETSLSFFINILYYYFLHRLSDLIIQFKNRQIDEKKESI